MWWDNAAESVNSVWWKATISALVGLLVGLLGEPFRQQVTNHLTARRVGKILYNELGRIYFYLHDERMSVHLGLDNLPFILGTDAFEFYYNEKREAFYLIPEHGSLRVVFDEIRVAREKLDSGYWQQVTALKALILRHCRVVGGINRQRLEASAKQFNQRFESMNVAANIETLKDWHPTLKRVEADGKTEVVVVPCDNCRSVNPTMEYQLMSTSINLCDRCSLKPLRDLRGVFPQAE